MKYAILALGLLASACGHGPVTNCAFKPIRPTPHDVEVISDRLASDLLAHNLLGERLCGWEP